MYPAKNRKLYFSKIARDNSLFYICLFIHSNTQEWCENTRFQYANILHVLNLVFVTKFDQLLISVDGFILVETFPKFFKTFFNFLLK